MQRLIPHIVAIEEYKAAALSRVLPPRWLEAADGLNPQRAVGETTVLEDKPLSGAEVFRPLDLSKGLQPPENPSTTPREQLPIRDTSPARAWLEPPFVPARPPLSLPYIL